MKFIRFTQSLVAFLLTGNLLSQAKLWTPDAGDGNYHNPILFADYSDPDIVRVGDDFFMTASSFNSVPGLPILHSKDLVNWQLVNYAIRQFPDNYYDTPQQGNGVWAPSIRHHDGWFYIYWGDPDRGIFRVKTQNPFGEWETPVQVSEASGNIDPCPLWDDDGKVYLVHAFANSRAGVKSILQVAEMTPDGAELTNNKRIVFMGFDQHPTTEGPKFYKRNGYYYIFAPSGGVATGWQTVMRSKNIWGPYEDKIVLAQGDTAINGPHQGGFVELDNGEGWFMHFQELQPYGRIVHLQPVRWVDDWPVIGTDPDGDGCGQPITSYHKPGLPAQPVCIPMTGDTFDSPELSLAWQWQATPYPGWFSLNQRPGQLRLKAVYPPASSQNLWNHTQLLLQKLPSPAFTVTTRLDPSALLPGERGGLVMMGMRYAAIAIERSHSGAWLLRYQVCEDAMGQEAEKTLASCELPPDTKELLLKCTMQTGGVCEFSWSTDGVDFSNFESQFQATEGRWIGAKMGLFIQKDRSTGEKGWIDFDYFHIE